MSSICDSCWISKDDSDLCWHNCGSLGSLNLLLWDCPAATMVEILAVDLPLSPAVMHLV